MKQPILLKTILDICFILLALAFFSAAGIFILTLALGEKFTLMELNGRILSEFTPIAIVLVTAELFIGGLILYTVYILRKLVRDFLRGKFFTTFQIATLNKIGQLIVVITLTSGLTDFLGKMLIESQATVRVGMDFSFGSFWFILAIGLFFMYLSQIFNNAKALKEENEFTV